MASIYAINIRFVHNSIRWDILRCIQCSRWEEWNLHVSGNRIVATELPLSPPPPSLSLFLYLPTTNNESSANGKITLGPHCRHDIAFLICMIEYNSTTNGLCIIFIEFEWNRPSIEAFLCQHDAQWLMLHSFRVSNSAEAEMSKISFKFRPTWVYAHSTSHSSGITSFIAVIFGIWTRLLLITSPHSLCSPFCFTFLLFGSSPFPFSRVAISIEFAILVYIPETNSCSKIHIQLLGGGINHCSIHLFGIFTGCILPMKRLNCRECECTPVQTIEILLNKHSWELGRYYVNNGVFFSL